MGPFLGVITPFLIGACLVGRGLYTTRRAGSTKTPFFLRVLCVFLVMARPSKSEIFFSAAIGMKESFCGGREVGINQDTNRPQQLVIHGSLMLGVWSVGSKVNAHFKL